LECLPDVVLKFRSEAEKRLFSLLERISLGPKWTAYHSLNLSEHEYKRWAEIDFLIVGPEGALVLEVKGGGVRRENGVWVFTDRSGREFRRSEGPFDQARTAMYALQSRLGDHHHVAAVREGRLKFGWGVVFPDVSWSVDTPEHPLEVVADSADVTDPDRFAAYLTGLLEYWRRKERRKEIATSDDLEAVRRAVRPDIDLYPTLTTRVGHVLAGMQRLTDEQYDRIRIIETNDRVLISGAAGTGKTFLALRLAEREVAQGRSVLLVVFSRVLASWLQKVQSDPRIEIHAVDTVADARSPVDVLIVDEGQDLVYLDALELLSSKLSGGLENGRWRWFMDENHQVGVSGAFDPDALEYLESGLGGGGVVRVGLAQNVRNTAEVARAVQRWTGADVGSASTFGKGREPRLIPIANEKELGGRLENLLSELLAEGAEPEEIGLVYPKGFEPARLGVLDRRFRKRLLPLDVVTARAELRGRILHGTTSDFKGLERPIIICLGFDDPALLDDAVDLYVSATRGNYGLYLIASTSVVDRLMTLAEDGE